MAHGANVYRPHIPRGTALGSRALRPLVRTPTSRMTPDSSCWVAEGSLLKWPVDFALCSQDPIADPLSHRAPARQAPRRFHPRQAGEPFIIGRYRETMPRIPRRVPRDIGVREVRQL